MEICDMDKSDMEMAMPYMYEVQYIKPVQPERLCGEKRNGGMVDRSVHFVRATRKLSYSSVKASTPLLMIKDGRLGHSDVPLDDGDNDFVNTPPRWQGTTFHANLPSREGQLVPNDFMIESVTALISSSMEEILTKFREKSRLNIVKDYEPLDKVEDAKITVDSKGKGKMETVVDVEFPYSLQPPSFDLGVCSMQPTPIEPTKSKKVETYVESVEYDVLQDTESAEKVESPVSALSFGFPVKRTPGPAKALQSPYVHKGKQIKHLSNVIIFQHYNQSADHADIADF
ncbi:Hypothetical predicted protein [Olea europaea subsp. europaea]|uniref:Uncharacterized protein n=1 Tax=Olea europaea subsp. europaea TaxID=158383 RepID=A0A8S0QKS5_OLEEU|nr:Hypothetical predicted protein [Olea europaea subsp. europaea]